MKNQSGSALLCRFRPDVFASISAQSFCVNFGTISLRKFRHDVFASISECGNRISLKFSSRNAAKFGYFAEFQKFLDHQRALLCVSCFMKFPPPPPYHLPPTHLPSSSDSGSEMMRHGKEKNARKKWLEKEKNARKKCAENVLVLVQLTRVSICRQNGRIPSTIIAMQNTLCVRALNSGMKTIALFEPTTPIECRVLTIN